MVTETRMGMKRVWCSTVSVIGLENIVTRSQRGSRVHIAEEREGLGISENLERGVTVCCHDEEGRSSRG